MATLRGGQNIFYCCQRHKVVVKAFLTTVCVWSNNTKGKYCCFFTATKVKRSRHKVYVYCFHCSFLVFISSFLFCFIISISLITCLHFLNFSLPFLLFPSSILFFYLFIHFYLFFSPFFSFSQSVFPKVKGQHFLQNMFTHSLCPSSFSSRYVYVRKECTWCVRERDTEIYVWHHGHHASSL